MARGSLTGWICIALAACDGGGGDTWTLVDESPASWMAIWGTSARDVWVVGGRPALTSAPQVAHYDGTVWAPVDVGRTGIDLWWVFGVPGSETHYLGGSQGVILRSRSGGYDAMPTPGGAAIVFGIWGTSDTDLWAVGSENGLGFVWRGDGTAWTALPVAVSGRLFKVHGRAANDVWIVGGGGVTFHWNGTDLVPVKAATQVPLFSVVTTATRTFAVGGTAGEGAIFEHVDGAWTSVAVPAVTAWRGVAASATDVFVVGEYGTAAHHDGATWSTEQANVQRNFHAAWIDPDGGRWGVGGDFDRIPLTTNGFVTYHGSERPRSSP